MCRCACSHALLPLSDLNPVARLTERRRHRADAKQRSSSIRQDPLELSGYSEAAVITDARALSHKRDGRTHFRPAMVSMSSTGTISCCEHTRRSRLARSRQGLGGRRHAWCVTAGEGGGGESRLHTFFWPISIAVRTRKSSRERYRSAFTSSFMFGFCSLLPTHQLGGVHGSRLTMHNMCCPAREPQLPLFTLCSACVPTECKGNVTRTRELKTAPRTGPGTQRGALRWQKPAPPPFAARARPLVACCRLRQADGPCVQYVADATPTNG